MMGPMFRTSISALSFAIATAALPVAAQDTFMRIAQADSCLPRREAVAMVQSGKAMPLRQLRGKAEDAAGGEMINAELCFRGGQAVYVITVLSTAGKVVYVTLNANNGQIIGTR
jgi:uncharacterized membrane protein YkoI